MTLYDGNNIAGGDPGLIRAEAARLGSVCDEITGVITRLRAVTTRGVWDSDAGEKFAAKVGEVPDKLDAVRVRLQIAANLLAPYAGLLEDAQQRMRHLETRYTYTQSVVDHCDLQLASLPPDAPERPGLTARRGEASEESYRIQETYVRVGDEIRADEERLAARLYDTAPELDDPQEYDFFEGLSNFGSGPVVNNPVTAFIKPSKVLGLATPIGDLGLLLAYDQGSWTTVAGSAKKALLEFVKVPEPVASATRQGTRGAKTLMAKSVQPATTKGKAAQKTSEVKVHATRLAQEKFLDITGVRLITAMATNWTAISSAGRKTKAKHVVGYTAAAAKQVDSTIERARKTAEVVKPLAESGTSSRRDGQSSPKSDCSHKP